ncbi:MAG: hypothetical protein HeimC3_20980 [Candidatus Heimdallarchaeota archaeon LC_3]|nr:MAG: hypothetical protein HeimC3_20980 [Candidatus Heimdallarchaeota archaeon LC_3]
MIKQIIIRNDSSKGYRITHNNSGFDENQLSDDLMLSLIPRSANKKKITYFYKETLESEILIKYVTENSLDEYDRPIAKSNCFFISEDLFNEKGLLYFVSPLLLGTLDTSSDEFFNLEDVCSKIPIRISFALKILLHAVLLYEQVFIYTPTADQSYVNQLTQLIASIEEFLPKEISRTLRMKSYVTKSQFNEVNLGITSDPEILNPLKEENFSRIVFKSENNPYILETDKSIPISPIIDEIIDVVLNPSENSEEQLQFLFRLIFSEEKKFDPRINQDFKERILARFNVKKTKKTLRKQLLKNLSRSTPKSLT